MSGHVQLTCNYTEVDADSIKLNCAIMWTKFSLSDQVKFTLHRREIIATERGVRLIVSSSFVGSLVN